MLFCAFSGFLRLIRLKLRFMVKRIMLFGLMLPLVFLDCLTAHELFRGGFRRQYCRFFLRFMVKRIFLCRQPAAFQSGNRCPDKFMDYAACIVLHLVYGGIGLLLLVWSYDLLGFN